MGIPLEKVDVEEEAKLRSVISQLVITREKGQDYRPIDIRAPPKKVEEVQQPSAVEVENVVSREIKHFRDKEAQREAGMLKLTTRVPSFSDKKRDKNDDHSDEERTERERKQRLERDREREREVRRLEREERDFRDKEREWENREKIKDRERENQRERREINREFVDMEYDDGERKRRSRDYYRRKRQREKELSDDQIGIKNFALFLFIHN